MCTNVAQLVHLRLADRGLPMPFPAHLLKINFFISSYFGSIYAPTRGQKKSKSEKNRSVHDCWCVSRLLAGGEGINISNWICKYFKNICFNWKRASSDIYFKRSKLIVLLCSTEIWVGSLWIYSLFVYDSSVVNIRFSCGLLCLSTY